MPPRLRHTPGGQGGTQSRGHPTLGTAATHRPAPVLSARAVAFPSASADAVAAVQRVRPGRRTSEICGIFDSPRVAPGRLAVARCPETVFATTRGPGGPLAEGGAHRAVVCYAVG